MKRRNSRHFSWGTPFYYYRYSYDGALSNQDPHSLSYIYLLLAKDGRAIRVVEQCPNLTQTQIDFDSLIDIRRKSGYRMKVNICLTETVRSIREDVLIGEAFSCAASRWLGPKEAPQR